LRRTSIHLNNHKLYLAVETRLAVRGQQKTAWQQQQSQGEQFAFFPWPLLTAQHIQKLFLPLITAWQPRAAYAQQHSAPEAAAAAAAAAAMAQDFVARKAAKKQRKRQARDAETGRKKRTRKEDGFEVAGGELRAHVCCCCS
jgi:hypothetical protein